MSFQAYLDTIEDKTGHTPRQLLAAAHNLGLDVPPISATAVIEWLKADYGLGRGHAMAIVHILKNGASIPDKHVGTGGTHTDESNQLWLDGKAARASSHTL